MASTTFTATGSEQTWVVPTGITEVGIDAYAGQGADHANGALGGRGGRARGKLAVTPGETLRLNPGRAGTTSRAGGEPSDVRQGGATLAHRVLVAGAGGGAGTHASGHGGDGGGTTGAAGGNGLGAAVGGGGGTQTAGGTSQDAAPGTLGSGGAGESPEGGDGGDGYYGGGGGSAEFANGGSGGGGGSGYTGGVTAASMETGVRDGDGQITLTWNVAPLAPTPTTPTDGATLDRTIEQRLAWEHNDEPGDGQSKFDLRYRISGTATWTTVTDTTANEFHDLAANTLVEDGVYEWQVRTYDQGNKVSLYSTLQTFTAASPPTDHSILSPTSGGTVSVPDTPAEWSAAEQDRYQVQRVKDTAGVIDDTEIYEDSGEVESTARSHNLTFDVNGRWEWIRLRIEADGIWSDWVAIRVWVSYTAPADPSATVTVGDAIFSIAATHPAPSGDQPAVTTINIWRVQLDGPAGAHVAGTEEQLASGTGIAPAVTFVDRTARSGVHHAYRIEAVGDNGVSAFSAWTE